MAIHVNQRILFSLNMNTHELYILSAIISFLIIFNKSILGSYSKLPLRPQKRSQVTGVTMLPFGHKGGMRTKNAECKQEDDLPYYLS